MIFEAGRTALRMASSNGDREIVKFLLSKNANINAKDKSGRTALRTAAEYGHPEIVELLRSHLGVQ